MKEREEQTEDFEDEEIGPEAEGMELSVVMMMILAACISALIINHFTKPNDSKLIGCEASGYNCFIQENAAVITDMQGNTLKINLIKEEN